MSLQIISKAQPTPGDVHVNRPLSNLSVAFMQDATDFVASQVFTTLPVPNKSDTFYTYDRGHFWRDAMKKRAPATESAGIGHSLSTGSYVADVWALHEDVSDQLVGNADPGIRPFEDAMSVLMQTALVSREVEWATKFFATGKWTTDRTGVASTPTSTEFLQWNDFGSDPLADLAADIIRIKERTGMRPNTLVLGARVWQFLKNHPDLLARVNAGQTSGPAMVARSTLTALSEIPRIFVMEGVKNTAAEGATNAFSFIGNKDALLVYSELSPGLRKPTGGYTFAWTGYTGATELGTRVSRFRMEHLKSERVELEMAFDMRLVAADLGVFYSGAVA